MITAYISIGNSDDKLTQTAWHEYYVATTHAIEWAARQMHGRWLSDSSSPFQNACWCVELHPDWVEPLKSRLVGVAAEYRQDSIAWAVAETEFLAP